MKSRCLFTISAPSGAGKTSLVKALLQKRQDIAVCVSHATRSRRPGEEDGKDYHFVSVDAFEKMIIEDVFLEHARVFDNYYGTSLQGVDDLLNQDKDVILEIDWQGALQIKQKIPDTVAIFILPPSREALRQRLTDRATDDAGIIERRMADADREMSHYSDAEYLVINDDFNQALNDLECIIHCESLKVGRQNIKNLDLIDSIVQETV